MADMADNLVTLIDTKWSGPAKPDIIEKVLARPDIAKFQNMDYVIVYPLGSGRHVHVTRDYYNTVYGFEILCFTPTSSDRLKELYEEVIDVIYNWYLTGVDMQRVMDQKDLSNKKTGRFKYTIHIELETIMAYKGAAVQSGIPGGQPGEGWLKIYENELSSPATSVTISDLNGNSDEVYLILVWWKNNYNGAIELYLRPNNDSGANYALTYYGYQTGVGPISGYFQNKSGMRLSYIETINYMAFSYSFLYAKSGGQRVMVTHSAEKVTTELCGRGNTEHGVWNNIAYNITSLVVVSAGANGIGVGSHIIVFKKVG